MRDYGIVSPQFWIGATGKSLRGNPEAQVLALYLMTSPHANMIGVYYCPVMHMAHETGLSLEGASKALQTLSEAGYCTYEGVSETVFVTRMAAYQIGESLAAADNRVKSIRKDVEKIASPVLRAAFLATYSEAFHLPVTAGKKPKTEAPSKPLRSQDQDQEQEHKKTPSAKAPVDLMGFASFWTAWPKSDRKEAKGKCLEAWIKAHAEQVVDEVLAHVERQKLTDMWTKQSGQFVPAPLVYINQRRWEGANDEAAASVQQRSFV